MGGRSVSAVSVAKAVFPYVQQFADRHGRERLYYRRHGRPRVSLRGPLGSPEFWEDFRAAEVAGPPKASNMPERAARGTWRWLCEQYFASRDFKALDDSTQRVRRRQLELTWEEPSPNDAKVLYAECPVDRFSARLVRVLRDRKADHPEAANARVKAIRGVFTWACEDERAASNPGREIKFLKGKSGGFHAWGDDEISRFEDRHPIGTKARLALALLLYTGQRRSDLVRFGRQHVRDGWLKFTQHKNRNRSPVSLELPILPELQSVIDRSPVGDLTFLVTEFRQAVHVERLWQQDARLVQSGRLAGLLAHTACARLPRGASPSGARRLSRSKRGVDGGRRRKLIGTCAKPISASSPAASCRSSRRANNERKCQTAPRETCQTLR